MSQSNIKYSTEVFVPSHFILATPPLENKKNQHENENVDFANTQISIHILSFESQL